MDDHGLISDRGRDYSFQHHVQTGSEAHQAFYPMGTGGFCCTSKAANQHEADQSSPNLVPRLRMRGVILPLLQMSSQCGA